MHKDSNRLLHRDIKPNNILLSSIEKSAIIADFGSVKYIPSDELFITASKNSLVYKPSESILNNEFNCQSDIYQTGLVLFQLLGGYFPNAAAEWLSKSDYEKALKISDYFDQQSFIEKIINSRIVKGKLIEIESLPSCINKQLKSIIKKATHPDLRMRYKSATDFLNAIFKFKSNATCWKIESENYSAKKKKGNDYRIIKETKGFIIEKSIRGNAFRKIGASVDSMENAIEVVEKN